MKTSETMRSILKPHAAAVLVSVILLCLMVSGCENESKEKADSGSDSSVCLTVIMEGRDSQSYTLENLQSIPDSTFGSVYSTVNDWPTEKLFAATGVKVESLLKDAGFYDSAQTVTFRSGDGYEMSFTREQLIDCPRYCYGKDDRGEVLEKEAAPAILSWSYKDGGSDLSQAEDGPLCFVMGQAYPDEHTNPAFVIGVTEVEVSADLPDKWEKATVFPAEGIIAAGEKVKLQHAALGKVKLYYTTDGTDPTVSSILYNPSTYQLELNSAIEISEDTIIKVLTVGYGRPDSDIAVFEFYTE